jgi:T5orf172 domain
VDWDKKLQEILANDPLGLLNVKPAAAPARNADERLVASFEEINAFLSANLREPLPDSHHIAEHQLFARLQGIRADAMKCAMLKKYDVHDLLKTSVAAKSLSIEDILNGADPLGLLNDDTAGLFDLKHITPTDKKRIDTDFVARRKPCKDFTQYEQKFKTIQSELKSGKRKIIDFKLGSLRQGGHYIHNGILLYIEKIDIEKKEHYRPDGTRVREDGRTRCIFENGTESNMLKRSIEKLLYENGQVVTESEYEVEHVFSGIVAEDQHAGHIYVVKSLSNDPKIRSIPNLYKIGYSEVTIEERLKNVVKEPTYLLADVHLITSFQCFNMNPQKFEKLIHQFFGAVRLSIDVMDHAGVRHSPREWFIAPLPVIEQAIHYFISGDILHYRYDEVEGRIVERRGV